VFQIHLEKVPLHAIFEWSTAVLLKMERVVVILVFEVRRTIKCKNILKKLSILTGIRKTIVNTKSWWKRDM